MPVPMQDLLAVATLIGLLAVLLLSCRWYAEWRLRRDHGDELLLLDNGCGRSEYALGGRLRLGSTGCLALTRRFLIYRGWLPPNELRIPCRTISGADLATDVLRFSPGRSHLRVLHASMEGGHASTVFSVCDAQAWLEALGRR